MSPSHDSPDIGPYLNPALHSQHKTASVERNAFTTQLIAHTTSGIDHSTTNPGHIDALRMRPYYWLISVIAVYLLLGIVAVYLCTPLTTDVLTITAVSTAITGLYAFYVYRVIRKDIAEVARYDTHAFDYAPAKPAAQNTALYLGYLALIPLWYSGQLIASVAFDIFGSKNFEELNEVIHDANPIVMMLLVIIIAPVVEEILFRGVLYQTLRLKMSAPIACLISAGIFAVVHGNLVQSIVTIGLSLVSTWMFEMTKNIMYSISLHVIFNTLALAGPLAISVMIGLVGLWGTLCVGLGLGALSIIILKKATDEINLVPTTTKEKSFGDKV